MNNKIICGDCLDVMNQTIPDESVDLIYMDPPFSSNRNYVGFWQKTKEELAFDDSHWEAGVLGYIKDLLQPRMWQCFRVLKDTGSIYVHCDYHANAHIRIMMDKIFGAKNFRNEIIWCYTGPSGAKKDFSKKHDTIFRYSKTDDYYNNLENVRIPYKELHTDKGKSGKVWGNHGKLQDKKIREEYIKKGKIPEDFWIDIPSGGHISPKERLGYPTQKPEALLERIIKASSNECDLVLDPFCGCGTTIAVAAKLNRKFIGIDIYRMAIKVMNNRLKELKKYPKKAPYFEWEVIMPHSIGDVRSYDWRNFQDWVCEKFGAMKGKHGADGGIDGTTTTNVAIYDIIEKRLIALPSDTIIQSKHFKESIKVGETHLKKFESTIRHNNKNEGIMVAWNFAKTIKQYVFEAKENGISIYCVEADWLYKQPTPKKGPYADDYKVGGYHGSIAGKWMGNK